jgi:DNA-binding transcriptional LysR family regulator
VVDHGGFAQAAHALHRSQSSVSYTVAKMQEQLDIPLLEIEGRKAVLTEAGEVLLRRSRALVKQASQLEMLAMNMDQGWEPEVRLVVDAAFPTARLAAALKAFMPLSQGCRVQLREEVLSGVSIAGYLPHQINKVEFIAVANPEHPLHHLQRQLTQDDLQTQLQVVIRDSGHHPIDTGWLGAEQRWTVTSISTAASLVASGLGFAWLPRHEIQKQLESGELLPLQLQQGTYRSHFMYLYANKDKPLGPATRILADLLIEHSMTD